MCDWECVCVCVLASIELLLHLVDEMGAATRTNRGPVAERFTFPLSHSMKIFRLAGLGSLNALWPPKYCFITNNWN